MNPQTLWEQTRPFLDYLTEWHARLPVLDLAAELKQPQCAAVVSEDLVKGFCTVGPLASPRVQAVVAPVVRMFKRAHDLGIPHYVLVQDTHEPDALEFDAYPPHCVRGTQESETIPELAALPFAGQFTLVPKNTTNTSVTPDFLAWLARRPEVHTFIVVGDCTDICVYQTAIDLRVRANTYRWRDARIIVPADCTDTFDMPVDTARSLGSLPHAGDLLHLIFLYHMALNGVQVVAEIR